MRESERKRCQKRTEHRSTRGRSVLFVGYKRTLAFGEGAERMTLADILSDFM